MKNKLATIVAIGLVVIIGAVSGFLAARYDINTTDDLIGDDKVVVISGPENAPLGDLVVLDASESNVDTMKWFLTNSDKTFLPVENNTKAVFASGTPGVYSFLLVGAAMDDENLVLLYDKWDVTIGDKPVPPEPEPGPEPEPEPEPAPDIPDDNFGNVGQLAASKAVELNLSKTQQVGNIYLSASRKLAGQEAPILPTIDSAVEYVKEEVKKVSPTPEDGWTNWANAINVKWREHVTDRESAAGFFKAVSEGLLLASVVGGK